MPSLWRGPGGADLLRLNQLDWSTLIFVNDWRGGVGKAVRIQAPCLSPLTGVRLAAARATHTLNPMHWPRLEGLFWRAEFTHSFCTR